MAVYKYHLLIQITQRNAKYKICLLRICIPRSGSKKTLELGLCDKIITYLGVKVQILIA